MFTVAEQIRCNVRLAFSDDQDRIVSFDPRAVLGEWEVNRACSATALSYTYRTTPSAVASIHYPDGRIAAQIRPGVARLVVSMRRNVILGSGKTPVRPAWLWISPL